MNKIRAIQNWTVPPVIGKTPQTSGQLGTEEPYVCLAGNVVSWRNIHNPAKQAEEGKCGLLMPIDIRTSEVVNVRLDTYSNIVVATRGGRTYLLEADSDRPSFRKHCDLFGIPKEASSFLALSSLVEKLSKKCQDSYCDDLGWDKSHG